MMGCSDTEKEGEILANAKHDAEEATAIESILYELGR